MAIRVRITNESAFSHGEVRVQLFQGPAITEGEHGIARPIESRALSVGESHAFTLEEGMYISAEEPDLKTVKNIPTHLPVFVME